MTAIPPFVTDLAHSRRLERTEASAGAAYVESRAENVAGSGAEWCDVAGTYAMFDGTGSPLTQSFGLGLFAPATAGDLDVIERFFADRGADAYHEVSPMADAALLTMLPARGYRPVEMTSILHMPLVGADGAYLPWAPPPTRHAVSPTTRCVAREEMDLWAEASAAGWEATPELSEFMRDFGMVSGRSRGLTCFVAELEGQVVATGALAIHGDVALLAGASTLPAWRGRGAQTALLASRLAFATERGCTLAMMGAAPGSTSQTNAERQGFRIAYTRTKWGRGPQG